MTNTIFKPEETRQPVLYLHICIAFSSGLVVKNPSANAEDAGSILGSGRSPGVGNGNPFQYPCLRNFMDRGAWQATVHAVIKSQTEPREWAHTNTRIKTVLTPGLKLVTKQEILIGQEKGVFGHYCNLDNIQVLPFSEIKWGALLKEWLYSFSFIHFDYRCFIS